MRAGRLDRRITIQRKTVTYSDTGAPVETWADIGARRRAAQMTPLRGDERFNDPELVAEDVVEFRVRYSGDVAELSALDRIIHPARAAADDSDDVPEVRNLYDVLGVQEIGRREGWQITARRRPDVFEEDEVAFELREDGGRELREDGGFELRQ